MRRSSGDASFATVLSVMLAAMAILAVQDAIVKIVSADMSIWQFNVVRSIFVLGILGTYALVARPATVGDLGVPGWAVVRSVLMVSAFVLFYGAMPFVSLSQAAAAFFTAPLFTACIGIIIGGEKARPLRLLALAAGFSGVLLIVKPWSAEPELALLLALGGAVCYAAANALMRLRLREASVIAVTAVQNVIYIQVALIALILLDITEPRAAEAYPFFLSAWRDLDGYVWGLLIVTALTQAIGAALLTRVYQMGDSSRVAPLEYVYLPMVVVVDLAVWGTVPDPLSLGGMAMIALAGIFVARSA